MTNKVKKAQGITMNTIVIAVLAILVLVTLAIIFSGKLFKFGQKTEEIESSTGNLDAATCQLKCNAFNTQCILKGQYNGKTVYYQSTNPYCTSLRNEIITKCGDYVSIKNTVSSISQGKEKIEDVQCTSN
jgi:hypothetical protein